MQLPLFRIIPLSIFENRANVNLCHQPCELLILRGGTGGFACPSGFGNFRHALLV
jgi:hypothetical protein